MDGRINQKTVDVHRNDYFFTVQNLREKCSSE